MTEGKLIPSKRQLDYLDWEFGVFFHFGIRSFYRGHRDWDNKGMPIDVFNPDDLDCEQWIKTAKEAGARYAIFVCKHHDGFANWPTKYSQYSVASTPWKEGRGDVVREFTDACRKYDMKVGLYYSPAQWGGAVNFSDEKDYDDYFINQITELLTGYGRIDYLWFDGNGSAGHEYDRERIIKTIRTLQPDITVFSMYDPDTRFVGNEDGYAPMPNFNVLEKRGFNRYMIVREGEEARFLPSECDFKMRSTWFDCEDNEDTVKELEELMGIYEMSVGRGANFLINIGPDCHGRLPEKDVRRLLEFGETVRKRYGHPLAEFGEVRPLDQDEYCIEIGDFDPSDRPQTAKPVLVNRLVIEEDISNGESVCDYEVYANLPANRRIRVSVYRGYTIGHKAICVFPTIKTARLTVAIKEHRGNYRLKSVKAYCVQQ